MADFTTMMTRALPSNDRSHILVRSQYSVIDTNKDGFATEEELASFLSEVGMITNR